MSDPAVEVSGLEVRVTGGTPIVEDVAFSIGRGEIVGIVGESGSGKTTTGLALLGYARPGAEITGGRIRLGGTEMLQLSPESRRKVRGKLISYVPQEPGQALNPALRVGDHIREMLRYHARERCNTQEVEAALRRVGLPCDRSFQRRFPHQLSGGQQQRLAIAAALAAEPMVVVFDEPTTGLDVATQAVILDEIKRLRLELELSAVYVTHDLAVVATIVDRVIVMYAGRVVEDGPVEEVLTVPRHPYTRGLLASVPDHVVPHRLHGIPGVAVGVGERPDGCPFAPRCPQVLEECRQELPPLEPASPRHLVRCIAWRSTPPLEMEPPITLREVEASKPLLQIDELSAEYRSRDNVVVAARAVSFAVQEGEAIALVGESGSGKTTIARCIAGLHSPSDGRIRFDGLPLAATSGRRSREVRRRIQIIFQNPNDSLNPRHPVAQQIARPAILLRGVSRRDAYREVDELLDQVRLPRRLAARYTSELSGGERQRIAIARALAAHPDLLVCDEITSALDVSVQAAVLDLLGELQRQLGLALLFISHDLGVVATVADRVIVLHNGQICETGDTRALLSDPQDAYTKTLLISVPRLPQPRTGAGQHISPEFYQLAIVRTSNDSGER